MLATLLRNCYASTPAPDTRRLLHFLVQQVHWVGSCSGSAGGYPRPHAAFDQLTRTSAGLAALCAVESCCREAGQPPGFAAQLYMQAACHAAMAASPGGGLEGRLHEQAARLVCLTLQVDATAVAAALDRDRRWRPAHPRRTCPSALALLASALAAPAAAAPGGPDGGGAQGQGQQGEGQAAGADEAASLGCCEAALELLDCYAAVPAAYAALVACRHPAVSLALLLAAAHLSDVDTSGLDPGQVAQAPVPTGARPRVAPQRSVNCCRREWRRACACKRPMYQALGVGGWCTSSSPPRERAQGIAESYAPIMCIM